jgi:threonylcarbamoyladenosine tRNA methylthiotransferase MtaB
LPKLINLGCKLNQYEGYCLLEKLSDLNDLVIVNTCCVTKEAETKSLKKFRQALRKFPSATIVATGCACRLHPEKYAQAQRVIDNVARNALIEKTRPRPDKARYFLKIQDGCDMECTYCIVSKVRTHVESKAPAAVAEEIAWAHALGYEEVVLVGANIGLYGNDIGQSLHALLTGISRMENLPRIRLSSIEPIFINKRLIDVLKKLPFCHHFHIPIQSADNRILNSMKRGYDETYLTHTIHLIHDNFTDVAIGVDIIVGFPGEGKDEFQRTYDFVEREPLTHLHVFSYSPRPGTEAFILGDPVPTQEKKNRLWLLRKLISDKNYQFRKSLLHKSFDVIVEKKNDTFIGLTGNYIRTEIDGPCPRNTRAEVVIREVEPVHTRAWLKKKAKVHV